MGIGAAMVAGAVGVSVPPASALPFKIPLAVAARDFQFVGVPGRLPAATYDVRYFNISRGDAHVFVALNLGPRCSTSVDTVAKAKDLIGQLRLGPDSTDTSINADLNAAGCQGANFGGVTFAPPGGRDRSDITLTPGRTLYFCDIPEKNGTPHFDLGMIGFINVFALPGGF